MLKLSLNDLEPIEADKRQPGTPVTIETVSAGYSMGSGMSLNARTGMRDTVGYDPQLKVLSSAANHYQFACRKREQNGQQAWPILGATYQKALAEAARRNADFIYWPIANEAPASLPGLVGAYTRVTPPCIAMPTQRSDPALMSIYTLLRTLYAEERADLSAGVVVLRTLGVVPQNTDALQLEAEKATADGRIAYQRIYDLTLPLMTPPEPFVNLTSRLQVTVAMSNKPTAIFDPVPVYDPAWEEPVKALNSFSFAKATLGFPLSLVAMNNQANSMKEMYALSNGTRVGQVARMLAVTDEYTASNTYDRTYDIDRFITTSGMQPLMMVADGPQPTLHYLYRRMAMSGENPYYRVEYNSDAGYFYNSVEPKPGNKLGDKKRANVIMADIVTHNACLGFLLTLDQHAGYLGERSDDAVVAEMEERFQSFLLEYRKRKVVEVKPKNEVTTTKAIYGKTRNVYVYNSSDQTLLGVFLRYVETVTASKDWGNNSNVKTAMSLSGWSAPYGNLNGLINRLALQAKLNNRRFAGMSYSDNFYIWDNANHLLYSIDVAKMEATSSPIDGEQMIAAYAKLIGVDTQSYLMRFMSFLAGEFSHNCTGVLGMFCLYVRGLMSGSQATFNINHFRMVNEANSIIEQVEANPSLIVDAEIDAVLAIKTPFRFTLTAVLGKAPATQVEAIGSTYLNLVDATGFVSAMEDANPGSTLETVTPLVWMDVLGFDGCLFVYNPDKVFSILATYNDNMLLADDVIELLRQATPAVAEPIDSSATVQTTAVASCLAHERLMKAIYFRKNSFSKQMRKPKVQAMMSDVKYTSATEVVNILDTTLHILTLYNLYWFGGFAYPDASAAIYATVQGLTLTLIRAILKTTVDEYDKFAEVLLGSAAPGMHQVDDLLTPFMPMIGLLKGLCRRWCVDIHQNFTHEGEPVTYMSNPTAYEIGMKTTYSEMLRVVDRRYALLRFHTPQGRAFGFSVQAKKQALKREVTNFNAGPRRGQAPSFADVMDNDDTLTSTRPPVPDEPSGIFGGVDVEPHVAPPNSPADNTFGFGAQPLVAAAMWTPQRVPQKTNRTPDDNPSSELGEPVMSARRVEASPDGEPREGGEHTMQVDQSPALGGDLFAGMNLDV